MGREKRYNMKRYLELGENSTGKCLLCNKELKTHMGNVKRHYSSLHSGHIVTEEGESSNSPQQKKKLKLQKVSLNMNRSEYVKSVVKAVTEMHMSFRVFDNEAFQNLLQPWTDGFGIKYNSKSIGVTINDMAKSLCQEIKEIMHQKYICLKLDIASRMERSIMGINIQIINKNFEVEVFTIGMVELSERHHSTYLKEQVLSILQKFDINLSQVYSVTTDNGANVVKTSKLLQEYSENDVEINEDFNDQMFGNTSNYVSEFLSVVHCAAHTLQLVAWDVLKNLKIEVSKCRESVKFIRKKMRESKHGPLPVLDNSTRWSSTYEMIKSLMECKLWIESSNTFTTKVDWEFCKLFQESFKPIADATTLLQYNQLVMGDFFREWLVCETELDEFLNNNSIAKSLQESLKRRKETLVDNKAFLAALYMDQRFNYIGSTYLNESQKKAAISHILTIYNKLKMTGEISDNNLGEDRTSKCVSTTGSNVERYRKLEINSLNVANRNCSSVQDSLEKLQHEEKLPFSANVLEFWKNKSFRDPLLSKLAAVALAVPATQVSVERAFSALPIIMTKNRRNLSSEHLENLLLLKLNIKLIDKITI